MKLRSAFDRLVKKLPFADKLGGHLPFITGFLLLFSCVLSIVYIFISSFSFKVTHIAVIGVIAVFSLFFAFCTYLRKHRRLIYICYTAVLLIISFCFTKSLADSTLAAINGITSVTDFFDSNIPISRTGDATFFITVLALILCCVFSFVIFERCSIVFAAASVAPVFILSYWLSGPAMWCEFIMLGSIATLILTHPTRKVNIRNGAKLTVQLAIPISLLLILMAALWPYSSYSWDSWNKYPYKLRTDIMNAVENLFSNDVYYESYGQSHNDYFVVMSSIGPLTPSYNEVMRVRSSENKSFYLRAKTYTLYSDDCWIACDEDSLTDLNFMPQNSQYYSNYKFIEIETKEPLELIYTPYYALESSAPTEMYGDSYLTNTNYLTSYTIKYTSSLRHKIYDPDYIEFIEWNATYLPPELSQQLYEIAEEAGITELPPHDIPNAVCEFVRNSAEYDLNAPVTPEGKNSIIWFLTESHRGYCMHYASACAAMLRALGIPARFVVGYYVHYDTAGEWTVVEERQSHAWTEYYDTVNLGWGWTPLEPTGCTPGGRESSDDEKKDEQVSQSDTSPSVTESATTTPTATTTTAFLNAQPSGVPRTGTIVLSSTDVSESDVSSSDTAPSPPRKNTAYTIIIGISLPLLALLGLLLARQAVLIKRDQSFSRGSSNDRAIALWGYSLRLCRALGKEPDETLLDIALKAKFSRHQLNDEEIGLLVGYRDTLLKELIDSDSPIKKLIHRYLDFLY